MQTSLPNKNPVWCVSIEEFTYLDFGSCAMMILDVTSDPRPISRTINLKGNIFLKPWEKLWQG